ncbi:MAG TPA: hypothetical protein VK900_12005 [Anaerolineales bacterium]|nr:hypothetical protein [Anaerolineales bacterium]
MWKIMLVLLLLAAHLNLTALVPLLPGDAPPPWWVGGMLFWPFDASTRTLIRGDLLNTLTPILAISSAILFLMAAAALLRRFVPASWCRWLIITGASLSIVLQVIWFSGWALFPVLVDAALLWAVFGQQMTVHRLRA